MAGIAGAALPNYPDLILRSVAKRRVSKDGGGTEFAAMLRDARLRAALLSMRRAELVTN